MYANGFCKAVPTTTTVSGQVLYGTCGCTGRYRRVNVWLAGCMWPVRAHACGTPVPHLAAAQWRIFSCTQRGPYQIKAVRHCVRISSRVMQGQWSGVVREHTGAGYLVALKQGRRSCLACLASQSHNGTSRHQTDTVCANYGIFLPTCTVYTHPTPPHPTPPHPGTPVRRFHARCATMPQRACASPMQRTTQRCVDQFARCVWWLPPGWLGPALFPGWDGAVKYGKIIHAPWMSMVVETWLGRALADM